MARVIVRAVHGDDEPRRWTLSERIVAENLADNHYTTQLLERLSWATGDAEALELHTPDRAADHADGARRDAVTTGPRDTHASGRLPLAGPHRPPSQGMGAERCPRPA